MNIERGIRWLLILSLCAPIFPGCATILSEKKYPVTFDNAGGPTFFAVRDRKQNVIHEGVTPQQVTLDAKAFPFWPAKYDVTFAGHQDFVQQKELKAGVDPWVAGNIILGGVPGAVIDGATGAMWKLPERVAGGVPTQLAMTDLSMGSRIAAASSKTPNDQNSDSVKQVHFQTPQNAQPGATAVAAPAGSQPAGVMAPQYTAPQYTAPQATLPQMPAAPAWPYSQPPSKPEPEPTSSCGAGCSH
jgi:hypothetical protein